MAPLLVAVGMLGLATGSFLGTVIHRVPLGEPVVGQGPRCPGCHAAIRPRDRIPVVSWLALRGRCTSCAGPISARYPIVEAGTAALFVAVTLRFGPSPALPAYLYLAAVAVALAAIDFDVRRLPDVIVLPSYLVGALLLIAASAASRDWWSGGRGLAAMIALFGCYAALAMVYPAGMGFGDVKLAGLLGLYLGWLGWSWLLVGAFCGFLLGGVVGVALLVSGRAGRKTAIPFGPYMLAGAMVAVFAAGPVATWYSSLLQVA